MPYKVSIRNEQRADLNGGYSESWWNDTASDTTVIEKTVAFATLLFNCKGFGANLPNARVTELLFFRNVFPVPLNLASLPQGITEDADSLTSKVLLKLTGANPKQTTRQWLGSVPDNIIARGGRFVWTSPFTRNFNAMKAHLIGGNGWCLRKQDPTVKPVSVLSITQAGVVTTTKVHGAATDELVRLSRVKSPTIVNKIYKVTVLSDLTMQLIGFEDPGEPIVVSKSTYVQRQVGILIPIRNVEVLRASSHKVGRPFDLSSGKATTKTR